MSLIYDSLLGKMLFHKHPSSDITGAIALTFNLDFTNANLTGYGGDPTLAYLHVNHNLGKKYVMIFLYLDDQPNDIYAPSSGLAITVLDNNSLLMDFRGSSLPLAGNYHLAIGA